MICLSILGLALAYSVLRAGGVSHQDWCITALAAGLAGLLVRRGNAGPLKGPIFWSAALLPCYVAFQMIPLPAGVLASVSRASAELAGSAAPLLQDVKFASISVATALTAEHLLRITTCTLVFLLVREIAARHPDRLWTLACPITIIAALEAAFGIMQVQSGNQPEAAGTWANRNHFAGFLEMALPFPVMYAVTALRRGRRRDQAPLGPAFAACFSLSIAALLLIAITQSLSRMGCAAALLGLCICGAGAIAGALKRHRTRVPARLALVVSAGTLAALLFVSAAPDRLIARV
ncbi:MAG: hypothetical protein M1541_02135, partial [Acidobacteria bacterium]|nr:hypothetical protein [Acidobacteriota bacterium]